MNYVHFYCFAGAKVVKIKQKMQEKVEKIIQDLREWKKVATFAAR